MFGRRDTIEAEHKSISPDTLKSLHHQKDASWRGGGLTVWSLEMVDTIGIQPAQAVMAYGSDEAVQQLGEAWISVPGTAPQQAGVTIMYEDDFRRREKQEQAAKDLRAGLLAALQAGRLTADWRHGDGRTVLTAADALRLAWAPSSSDELMLMDAAGIRRLLPGALIRPTPIIATPPLPAAVSSSSPTSMVKRGATNEIDDTESLGLVRELIASGWRKQQACLKVADELDILREQKVEAKPRRYGASHNADLKRLLGKLSGNDDGSGLVRSDQS